MLQQLVRVQGLAAQAGYLVVVGRQPRQVSSTGQPAISAHRQQQQGAEGGGGTLGGALLEGTEASPAVASHSDDVPLITPPHDLRQVHAQHKSPGAAVHLCQLQLRTTSKSVLRTVISRGTAASIADRTETW